MVESSHPGGGEAVAVLRQRSGPHSVGRDEERKSFIRLRLVGKDQPLLSHDLSRKVKSAALAGDRRN